MDLLVALDRDLPLRPQLERGLREAIRSGRLHPGAPLPPTRTLAIDLGVSRGVVVEAYAQLVAEGHLTARTGAGTRVAERAAGAAAGAVPAARSDPRGPAAPAAAPVRFDLRPGRPDLSAFPRAAWHAAHGRALRTLPDAALGYGDPRGHEPLRTALAAQLGRTRGVLAGAGEVVVCGGLAQGLSVVWGALARGGARRVAVEDPGWRGQRRSAAFAGVEAVPVPVDERGLVVEAIPADVGAVVVTPAHQFPTGVVLAPERRHALVAWARATGGIVVEDDYDAEYRYDRDPVGAVQGLAPECVVYAGSASKTLAPALRLGWLVVPEHLVAAVAAEKDRADRGTPVLQQAVFADLLARGEVDRHLRRTRRVYRARRDALVAALAEHLPGTTVRGAAAGLHLVVELAPVGEDAGAHEAAVAAAARARGVAVEGLHAECVIACRAAPTLLLNYAALPEATLARAASELGRAARAVAATAAAR